MTAPTSGIVRLAEDTRRRFLIEIAKRVPIERIVEVHLFSPIRQSGVETGVAIVAAERVLDLVPPADASLGTHAPLGTDAPTADAAEPSAVEVTGDQAATDIVGEDAIVVPAIEESIASEWIACDPTEDAAADVDAGDIEAADVEAADVEAVNLHAPIESAADANPTSAEVVGADTTGADIDDSSTAASDAPSFDDDAPPPVVDLAEALEPLDESVAAEAEPEPNDEPVEPPAPPVRHTVFMARYRLTIKGPDRGKWDADVVEEADAPLVAVDAVVRGVQRRAGDASEPDRLGGDTVARILAGEVGAA